MTIVRERGVPDADVVVVGGGITGSAVARDAVARGLSVILVERTDIAAGTSGRSTKLLHGGLRYLEQGRFGLVREALREREITARLAPAWARPMRFYVPVAPGVFPGRWAARIGVGLYDTLSLRSTLGRGGFAPLAEIRRAAPALSGDFREGVYFMDRQTDDAQLTLAIARDAKRRGARIRLGEQVTGIARNGRGFQITTVGEDGSASAISAACVVNASGPWSDGVRSLAGATTPLLKRSRGAHLILEGVPLTAALLVPGDRAGQRLFAIPWRDAVLFGTTDVADTADPGRDVPEIEDLRFLFQAARRIFPAASLTRRRVLSSFTGVRPLIAHPGDTLSVSREHRVIDEAGLVTIAGGKLTTWRAMAIATVDAVVARLARGGRSPRSLLFEELPGGNDERPELPAALADGLARHADDVVFRRLPIGHDPRQVTEALPAVVAAMAARLGWSAPRQEDERARVQRRLDADRLAIDRAIGDQ